MRQIKISISDLDLKKIDLSEAFDYQEVDLVTEQPDRLEKSLLNSFPFKRTDGVQTYERDLRLNTPVETYHVGTSRAHAAPSPGGPRQEFRQLEIAEAREERKESVEERPSFSELTSSGRKCIDKVELVEETEYDTVVTCDHSYDKRCHTSYTTGKTTICSSLGGGSFMYN